MNEKRDILIKMVQNPRTYESAKLLIATTRDEDCPSYIDIITGDNFNQVFKFDMSCYDYKNETFSLSSEKSRKAYMSNASQMQFWNKIGINDLISDIIEDVKNVTR